MKRSILKLISIISLAVMLEGVIELDLIIHLLGIALAEV